MWRSLVARLLWEQDVAGSNPVIPTMLYRAGPSEAGSLLSGRGVVRSATRRFFDPFYAVGILCFSPDYSG